MSPLSPFAAGRRLARARDGIAAVEFALVFPVMALLFMGSFEVTSMLMADLKLTTAADTAADLVGQLAYNATTNSANWAPTDFANFTTAAEVVMTPLPIAANQLKIAYAGITYTTGQAVLDWHVEANGATALTLSSIPPAMIAANLINSNALDSLIVVNAQYTYASPTTYFLTAASYTLSEWSVYRPRYVNCVAVLTTPTPAASSPPALATPSISVTALNATGVCP